jgi:hypothetical protein
MTGLSASMFSLGQVADADASHHNHWLDVMVALSMEVSAPLTLALERVQRMLDAGGHGDTGVLQALSDEIAQARRISMAGQQLARLASGRLRQSLETVQLSQTLHEVLALHAQGIAQRGIAAVPCESGVEVVTDPVLLFNLLDAMLAWCIPLAQDDIVLCIDIKTTTENARLSCEFLADISNQTQSALDNITWRVLEQTAWTMGLTIKRRASDTHARLSFEFPRTVHNPLEGVSTIELDHGLSPLFNTKPLAGNQLLVVASRADLRAQIRSAIRDMGLIVEFVHSVDEALAFCKNGLPHLLVFESALNDARLQALRSNIDASGTQVAFVEILEARHDFSIAAPERHSSHANSRVGREVLATTLPSALVFERSQLSCLMN